MGIEITVNIVFGEAGAREAARRNAITVVIDALRASATITTALALGVREVIPAGSVEEALQFRGRPGYLVAGERGGVKLPEFDLGNSPTALSRQQHRIAGRVLVLTTSNGTRIVRAAQAGAEILLIGTTINAAATARAAFELAQRHRRDIVLVAAGEDEVHADEDYVAAYQIAYYLHQLGARVEAYNHMEEDEALEAFLQTQSARHLFDLGLVADVFYCAQRDLYAIVPWLKNGGFVRYKEQ